MIHDRNPGEVLLLSSLPPVLPSRRAMHQQCCYMGRGDSMISRKQLYRGNRFLKSHGGTALDSAFRNRSMYRE
jgi:hypothetical protein